MPFHISWVENFDKITLSCTFKKIEANFCFSVFSKNSKIQNGRHFREEENFLKIGKSTFLRYPMGQKFQQNHSKETGAILCFAILGKNSKIQNGCHIWGGDNFLKIVKSTLVRYHVGRKFRRNGSILHS